MKVVPPRFAGWGPGPNLRFVGWGPGPNLRTLAGGPRGTGLTH